MQSWQVIGRITGEIAVENLNIVDMINKSRNEIAITLIELQLKPSTKLIDIIKKMKRVFSVRIC